MTQRVAIWGSLQKDVKHNSNNGEFHLNRGVINQCSSSEAIFCNETPKMSENFKYGSKILKKPEKQQKQPHVILKASDHVYGYTWYAKPNPPYGLISG